MKSVSITLGVVALATSVALPAQADPCGMVPPLVIAGGQGQGAPIRRVGAQKTYVAYKDGVESIVLRPGFEGKVDEFGMLIPFPSAPAIRKVDDNIFPHIAAAIDPPEVLAYVQRRPRPRRSKSARASSAPAADDEGPLRYDEVRVVSREAVGMYDVAVLEAGSPRALKRWMDSHQFRYPKGMDDVVQDYVNARWVFVAVKTKVGKKDGVNPRPGMRDADSKLPAGSTFNGHVQAMGFRFKSKELVVPMRLSAFNEGKLRNVVYALTEGPIRAERIPKRFVVRQVRGRDLYRNLTGKLPLRVIGGKKRDLSRWQRQNLKARRDPTPHNGLAKDLFAGDMLAFKQGRLANPHEEEEKELLAIGERLGLRGTQIDALHREALGKARGRAAKRALRRLRRMTMTVIDGEFDRDTVAEDNIQFARYRMPPKRNNRKAYDALQMGPGINRGGTLYRSSLDLLEPRERGLPGPALDRWAQGLGLGLVIMLGGFMAFRRRSRRRLFGGLTLIVALAVGASAALAESAELKRLIGALSDEERAGAALAEIVKKHGEEAVDPLLDEAVLGKEMTGRGWAIVALGEIGGDEADRGLEKIHQNTSHPMLVRTWAAAARVEMAKSTQELAALANLVSSFPALQRPLGLRVQALVGDIEDQDDLEGALGLSQRVPAAAGSLQQKILAAGPGPLTQVMVSSKNQGYRRWAASYLANLGRTEGRAVARATIRAIRFRRGADSVPWRGGALFLPAISWQQREARILVDCLLRWYLWAELAGDAATKQQIHNNLRSVQLASAAGYVTPSGQAAPARVWLATWKGVVGKKRVAHILRQQRVHRKAGYRDLLRD